jgi:hypothetical protein
MHGRDVVCRTIMGRHAVLAMAAEFMAVAVAVIMGKAMAVVVTMAVGVPVAVASLRVRVPEDESEEEVYAQPNASEDDHHWAIHWGGDDEAPERGDDEYDGEGPDE